MNLIRYYYNYLPKEYMQLAPQVEQYIRIQDTLFAHKKKIQKYVAASEHPEDDAATMIYNGGNSMYDVIRYLDKKQTIKSYTAAGAKEHYATPQSKTTSGFAAPKKIVQSEPSNNMAIYAQQTSVDPMYQPQQNGIEFMQNTPNYDPTALATPPTYDTSIGVINSSVSQW